jgi:hypothetical protein
MRTVPRGNCPTATGTRTTLSRASTQVVASSTGSQLTLTSAATAALVIDAAELQPHLGGCRLAGWNAVPNGTAPTLIGTGSAAASGTNAGVNLATTNFLSEQARIQYTSATTASAQAGISSTVAQAVYSTASGRGGFEFTSRFGASGLPTAPRVFVGLTATTYVGSTAEPSALVASFAALTLDSTDTNLQFTTNDNSGGGGKNDTGIPFVVNGWYEVSIWAPPGGGSVSCILVRLDTGAIWYGTTALNLPANGALLAPHILGGLNGTNTGTAFVFQFGSMTVRAGVG